MDGHRAPTVCRLVGITYRQLDYWTRTGLIRPTLREARGSGSQRLFTDADVVRLRIIRTLLDAGMNLTEVRAALDLGDGWRGIDLFLRRMERLRNEIAELQAELAAAESQELVPA